MRRFTPLAGLCLALALACYTDDIPGPGGGKPAAVRVLLTDSPIPYDSVAAVNIYVDSIEASTSADTTGPQSWVTVTAPHRVFNLLTVQQGDTALVGQGQLPAGTYKSVRLTMDVDSSAILHFSAAGAYPVHWGSTGRITLNVLVSPPVTVNDSGTDIVLDFDAGLSFPFDNTTKSFGFTPWLRAVNSAEAGAIAGTLSYSTSYGSGLLPFASLTVYNGSRQGSVLATGHTDLNGQFRVAFLPAGAYTLGIDPENNDLSHLYLPMTVSAGSTVDGSAIVPAVGVATLHLNGPTSVQVGGAIALTASVQDSAGVPVNQPNVVWTSSNTAVATTVGHFATDTVYGQSTGSTMITAVYQGVRDSLQVTVVAGPSNGSVATVTVTPDSQVVTLADSAVFIAVPKDSVGNPTTPRPVTWTLSDSTLAHTFDLGDGYLILYPVKVGTLILTATSEGKTGTGKLLIH